MFLQLNKLFLTQSDLLWLPGLITIERLDIFVEHRCGTPVGTSVKIHTLVIGDPPQPGYLLEFAQVQQRLTLHRCQKNIEQDIFGILPRRDELANQSKDRLPAALIKPAYRHILQSGLMRRTLHDAPQF